MNYKACDAQDGLDCSVAGNWHTVAYGVPVDGQYVKNP